MTIVHIGSLPLQVPESGSANFINELVEQMRSKILHLFTGCLISHLHLCFHSSLARKYLSDCLFHRISGLSQQTFLLYNQHISANLMMDLL